MTVQRITLRRGTTAQWLDANPILAFGEIGVEVRPEGAVAFKLGDNVSTWTDLEYFESGSFADYLKGETLGEINGIATLDENASVPLSQLLNAKTYSDAALLSHATDTTNIHGISDTANLATKEYVDNVAAGITTKPAVEAATTSNLSATYSNGALGVGATLTATSNGTWPGVDGVASGWDQYDGILVKDQSDSSQNGRYVLLDSGSATTPWILRRCSLCDTAEEIPGMYIFVKFGDINAGAGFVALVDSPETFVVGTNDISIVQFSGGTTISGGTGITVDGTQISIDEAVVAKLSSPTFSGTVTATTFAGTATNSNKVSNHQVYVQTSAPSSGMVSGDIWIKTV